MRNLVRTIVVSVLATLALSAPASAEVAPFIGTQHWDSCTAIAWEYDGSPRWRSSWEAAVARVSAVTGYTFVEAGPDAAANIAVTWGDVDQDHLAETRSITYGYYANIRIDLGTPQYLRGFRRHGRLVRMSAIMMHELGHSLGLGHAQEAGLLMSESISVKHMKPDDVAAFRSLNTGCVG